MAFLCDPGVIFLDQSTPFGMSTELLNGNELEVAQRTGIKVGMNGFVHVLVSPFALNASQQISDDPPLRRFGLLAVFDECPFPNAPENATEDAASVAVGETRRLDDVAVFFCAFRVLRSILDQVTPRDSSLEEPAHVSVLRLLSNF